MYLKREFGFFFIFKFLSMGILGRLKIYLASRSSAFSNTGRNYTNQYPYPWIKSQIINICFRGYSNK